MINYNPEEYLYHHLDSLKKKYNELLAETDSQPKNLPVEKLAKEEFYKLLEEQPWHLYANVYDETEDRNCGKVIWLPLCKEPLPLEEVMKLRELYKKNYESYLSNSL